MDKASIQQAIDPKFNWLHLIIPMKFLQIKLFAILLAAPAIRIFSNDIPTPSNIANGTASTVEIEIWKAIESIDSSDCTLMGKMYRGGPAKSTTPNPSYLLLKLDSFSIDIDSASIINDLNDELSCEEDSGSIYSQSVKRTIKNLHELHCALPKSRMDSLVVLNAISSLYFQNSAMIRKEHQSKISTSTHVFAKQPYAYGEVLYLYIDGLKNPHARKLRIQYGDNPSDFW